MVDSLPLVGRFEGNVGVFRAYGRLSPTSHETIVWDRTSPAIVRRIALLSEDGDAAWRTGGVQEFARSRVLISDPSISP
jgi:hypothetical protein